MDWDVPRPRRKAPGEGLGVGDTLCECREAAGLSAAVRGETRGGDSRGPWGERGFEDTGHGRLHGGCKGPWGCAGERGCGGTPGGGACGICVGDWHW